MTIREQEYIKQKGYALAMRYMDNAKESLKKAGRDGRYFKDSKYVSSASGIAYRGVLIALDTWLQLKGVELLKNVRGKKTSRDIDFYRGSLTKLDKRLLRDLNGVYDTLHLSGYYDCTLLAATIDAGFAVADEIIHKIKPRS
jgi:hypothetical protein